MSTFSRLAHLTACALVAVAPAARPQGSAPQPADLLLVNTRIYTVDQSHPFVQAMAVRDGRVQFVGSTQEAMLLRGPSTRVLDLDGSTVIPGMIDAHAHLFGLGTFLQNIDLTDTRSYDEVVARVAVVALLDRPVLRVVVDADHLVPGLEQLPHRVAADDQNGDQHPEGKIDVSGFGTVGGDKTQDNQQPVINERGQSNSQRELIVRQADGPGRYRRDLQ